MQWYNHSIMKILFSSLCVDVTMDVSDAKGNKEIMIQDNVKKVPFGLQEEGCRFTGNVVIKKVAGDISFFHAGSLNIFSFHEFLNFNASHTIQSLTFGPLIPYMETPLIDVTKIIVNNGTHSNVSVLLVLFMFFLFVVATYKYFVNIVPSKYVYLNGRETTTYQYSVTEHETKSGNQNGQMTFPGIIMSYEFSPIAVEYVEEKPSFLQFMTSTSAIIGGVFAVARMLDGAIYSVSSLKKD